MLKRELLWDPCLDIVGLRVPNYFVDRSSQQSVNELAAVTRLSADLATSDVAVIFPEGTRSSDTKRKRAVEKIRDQSPERVAATEGLRHLIPVRPSGTLALLEGAPCADIVIAWHTGFDGLSTFGGVIAALGRSDVHIVFRARRLQRSSLPDVNVGWLDDIWVKMDREGRTTKENTMNELLLAALTIAILMVATWLISVAIKDASIVDISWGLGFATVATVLWIADDSKSNLDTLLWLMTLLWGLRLCLYLARRNLGHGEDYRYVAMRKRWGSAFPLISFLTVYTLQGTLMWVVSLPIQLSHSAEGSIGVLAVIGVVLWAVGLYFEVVGDIHSLDLRQTQRIKEKCLTQVCGDTATSQLLWRCMCGGELRSSHARSVLACGGSLVPL